MPKKTSKNAANKIKLKTIDLLKDEFFSCNLLTLFLLSSSASEFYYDPFLSPAPVAPYYCLSFFLLLLFFYYYYYFSLLFFTDSLAFSFFLSETEMSSELLGFEISFFFFLPGFKVADGYSDGMLNLFCYCLEDLLIVEEANFLLSFYDNF